MTTNTAIIGVGRTPVAEHWGLGLRELAADATQQALDDSGATLADIDALVIGNALSGSLNQQNHIAALLADHLGLRGAETVRVEAGEASGGMAVRQGMLLITAGLARTVLVLGVEKVTDLVGHGLNDALATLLDSEYEAAHGATPTAMAGLLMRRYMHEYGLELDAFEGFSINAHANGGRNPGAMFRNQVKPGRFATAPVVAPPVNLFDSAPEGDGAAALVLTRAENAPAEAVTMLASAAATDIFALHNRPDPLFLHAVNLAAGRAYQAAGLDTAAVDVLELHDAYTVLSALQLEAAGFAARGQGWQLAAEGALALDGSLPISTFGGLKARGNPLGATGVYQTAEVTLQLRGQAEENQVADVNIGMTLNLGSMGASAVVNLFSRG